MELGNTRDLIRNGRQSAVEKGSFRVIQKMADRINSLEFQLKQANGRVRILEAALEGKKG